MVDYRLDLSGYPAFLHRIVKSWYVWEEIYLRKQGRYPGYDRREPTGSETREQIFWGRRPPQLTSSNEMGFIDEADVSY